ncbi:ATP-binding protein [Rhodoferax sp. PAMC 29310]|uniref:ATP-binding protein n=1 Tax=Rhodoferax sp. PAMC 29310 TaxID=2822760 RepID=UPI001B341B74|nr:ATP-binding protein [Rhodoferax sp. PAMC 29310]
MGTALDAWVRKLEHLLTQEAIVADPAQKFALIEQVEEARRKIAELSDSSENRTGKATADFAREISRIVKYAPEHLIGREDELALLSEAWSKVRRAESRRPHIVTFVALGGEGKTSLVAKWTAELAHQGWPDCDAAFAWSFYSQGSRDQSAASSDLFLAEALRFFGDAAMAKNSQSAFDKARRLAQLVGERRVLLILDGVEPLQYAPTSPTPGELKDQGLVALLKALATNNRGLCVLTTRYAIPDLRAFRQTTAPQLELKRLTKRAGVALLQSLGVIGTQPEWEKLVEDVRGHALTLNLMGSYLRDAHGGDIRKRDLVNLEEADAESEQGGHAFRVMDAYVQWFSTGGKSGDDRRRGQRAIVVLQLLGLFDRPATSDCLAALLKTPVIPNLIEPLAALTVAQRHMVFARLESANLLTVNQDAGGNLISLDAHPLLREYFAKQLEATQPTAWRAAHARLYEHLCSTTKEGKTPTLEDLQPLYQAVSHGCQAGAEQDACVRIFRGRIQRSQEEYSTRRLGAFGFNMGALACFFDVQWTDVSHALSESDRAWVMAVAAYTLRALGRLTEAVQPSQSALSMRVEKSDWAQSSISASNLSELELTLGSTDSAIENAELSVTYAHRSGEPFRIVVALAKVGDVLHQAGRRSEAEKRFRDAEALQTKCQPTFPFLYSVQGFRFCDLLLTGAERSAWRIYLKQGEDKIHEMVPDGVARRAAETLRWLQNDPHMAFLSIALNKLTLGRAALYTAILAATTKDALRGSFDELKSISTEISSAVDDLRIAGDIVYLPYGLITRAWVRCILGHTIGLESAKADLDEAWEIAERGPMPLFLADIHLHRAKLFLHATDYPWNDVANGNQRGPEDDLRDARRLIIKHSYLRRIEELEEVEAVVADFPECTS